MHPVIILAIEGFSNMTHEASYLDIVFYNIIKVISDF